MSRKKRRSEEKERVGKRCSGKGGETKPSGRKIDYEGDGLLKWRYGKREKFSHGRGNWI